MLKEFIMTESIFADIFKNYQYSSEHARMKAEQREKRYLQEQDGR
jgi:hypothetical protein